MASRMTPEGPSPLWCGCSLSPTNHTTAGRVQVTYNWDIPLCMLGGSPLTFGAKPVHSWKSQARRSSSSLLRCPSLLTSMCGYSGLGSTLGPPRGWPITEYLSQSERKAGGQVAPTGMPCVVPSRAIPAEYRHCLLYTSPSPRDRG